MKTTTRKWFFPLFFLLITLNACGPTDDCSDYADSPNPFFIAIKFIDADSGENLLLNGEISQNDIQLKGSKDNLTSNPPATDTPLSTVSFNLGTEHQQAKINWEFTVKGKPTFTINFDAIETKTNKKCAGPRHYFYPDRESLRIIDSNGEELISENSLYVLKI